MKKLGLFAIAVTAFVFGLANASAVEYNGKKGIGYAQAISGVHGIAFNYGMNKMHVEGILGVSLDNPKDNDGMGRDILLGVGLHYQALQAKNAAFTIGARFNLGMGQAFTPKGADTPDSSTEIGLDIPMRVYWFADEHVSLHVETGLSYQSGPKEGNVFGTASAEGSKILLGTAVNSGVGMTFWW